MMKPPRLKGPSGWVMPNPSPVHSYEDARRRASKRLPRLSFDFIEGAAGREVGAAGNVARLDEIKLRSIILTDVSESSPETSFLGKTYAVPFGVAPMGMCALAHPKADRFIAEAAVAQEMPVCLSSAGSSTMEDMQDWAKGNAWFQLYFFRSAEVTLEMADRARNAGYDTLILTTDVPKLSKRPRDLRNGFDLPFRMTPRSFLNFAMRPRWSLGTLMAGLPAPQNYAAPTGSVEYDRNSSRSGADWEFLARLRDRWDGSLIVKGAKYPEVSARIRDLGVDAIYVSNHGARQLDSEPPAIDMLPPVRQAVGPDYPLLFDSGVRSGEDILKALALGANFVMLGRPILLALGADGRRGLASYLAYLAADFSSAMTQVGARGTRDIGPNLLKDHDGVQACC